MQTIEAIQQLRRWIERQPSPVSVIAVDGHSAAGKSTFADEVVAQLGAACVRGDDFYRVLDPEFRAGLTPREGVNVHFDWERMLSEAIEPLRSGQAASFRRYDWADNRLADHVSVIRPAEVVVVEGVYAARPELDHVVDFSVVVVAAGQERRQRQLNRNDASQEWLDRWDAAETWYFRNVRPVESFDIVVSD